MAGETFCSTALSPSDTTSRTRDLVTFSHIHMDLDFDLNRFNEAPDKTTESLMEV